MHTTYIFSLSQRHFGPEGSFGNTGKMGKTSHTKKGKHRQQELKKPWPTRQRMSLASIGFHRKFVASILCTLLHISASPYPFVSQVSDVLFMEAGLTASSLHRAHRGIAKMIDSSCDYLIPWTCAYHSFGHLGSWPMLRKARAVRLSHTSLALDARLGEKRHELFAELRKKLA